MSSRPPKVVTERNLRFQDWQTVGTRTFVPNDLSEVVGSFSMGEDDDTLWVRITQLNGQVPQVFSYGILSWKTTNGYELGSTKAYGETESEVFRLGIGRAPSVRTGSVTFEPRGFNLGWIREGFDWTLQFEASSGTSSSGGGLRAGAVINSFVNTANTGLSLVRVNFP